MCIIHTVTELGGVKISHRTQSEDGHKVLELRRSLSLLTGKGPTIRCYIIAANIFLP